VFKDIHTLYLFNTTNIENVKISNNDYDTCFAGISFEFNTNRILVSYGLIGVNRLQAMRAFM